MNLSHKTFRHFLATMIASYLVVASVAVQSEQLLKIDGYDIHYIAFNSAMLTPEIATQYEIPRSTSLGVINISVINNADKAVTAFIEGQALNPISQQKILNFKKITEGDAIYYIATFNFADQEQLTFNIDVVPDGEKKRLKLSFKQQFFVG